MLLLKNCYCILTDWEHTLRSADILIRGNRIKKVGPDLSPAQGDGGDVETLDCSRFLAVPGFVNTHHHFYQTLTRNLKPVQNAKLFDWLVYLYDVWSGLDGEGVLVSSLLAMAELLKTGCTCSTDHHYLYPEHFSGDLTALQFEAAEALGMRFSPCRGSMSLSKKNGGLPPDSVVQTEEAILRDSRRVIETFHDPDELSMRRIILAPCSPFSVTPDLMRESAGLARSFSVRLHTHLAETEDENEYCLKRFGKRPLALMEDYGFLGDDVSYAHGVHFTDEELALLAETGTSIAHCPSSNMRLGSGIARVREMLDRRVNVGLAVDGSASNDSSDFVGEMRNALLLGRVIRGADGMTVEDVYRMATVNGARLLGYSRIGKIAEGWGADLALFDLHRIEYAGSLSDPPAALVFAGMNHGAAYTIVNGRVAVREGRLTGMNEDDLFVRANDASARLTG